MSEDAESSQEDLAQHTHLVRAALLCGAVDALRDSIGPRLWHTLRQMHDQRMAAARAQLGESAWQAALAEGQAMTLQQAIDEALADDE
jgi:hypothetical protein